MNASVRLGVSSLRAHKRRFAGTFVAVFLGTDAVVRSADAITTSAAGLRPATERHDWTY